ncbi:hydroxymethylglutaryl-CoA lyase [Cytophagaceae bacterium ABcell3]|nr:hydroxymethylglutaryl-CoA lyase [Cytophagaceae bacterium ABcell3]
MGSELKIIECPRDAMQGITTFIPTEVKIAYINLLLKVGFHTIDFGSFVSPTAVPQMKDTAQVLDGLDIDTTRTLLLSIIANRRGAEDAASFDAIKYLGFPLSVSETFQQRNTNKTIGEALTLVEEIQEICIQKHKEQVVYLSMGFGNPYGDPYEKEYIVEFVGKLDKLGVKIISLSDTIGVSDKDNIHYLFESLIPAFPHIEFGAHLHAHPKDAKDKVRWAYEAGCRRFDGALKGFGGCPMAKDDLVGNIATENIISFMKGQQIDASIDQEWFDKALHKASEVFLRYK